MNQIIDRHFSIPIPILAALGIPAEADAQISISLGPLLDPYFELGIPAPRHSDPDNWKLTGSPEGPIIYGTYSDASASWNDLFNAPLWIRDTVNRGILRMDHGWQTVDQVAHFLLIEQIIDSLLAEFHDFHEAARAVTSWLDTESGHGWFPVEFYPVKGLDLRSLADHLNGFSCRWLSRHHLALRTGRALVHEQGSTYTPKILVALKQDKVWVNPALLAAIWHRLTAYALGMPRIPLAVISAHARRPSMLRLLTGWVIRAGWRAQGTAPVKIPIIDLPSWYGHGPGTTLATLRTRVRDDIARMRLAVTLPPEAPLPELTSTSLSFRGLQGVLFENAEPGSRGLHHATPA